VTVRAVDSPAPSVPLLDSKERQVSHRPAYELTAHGPAFIWYSVLVEDGTVPIGTEYKFSYSVQ
jgi:hypothetical protein